MKTPFQRLLTGSLIYGFGTVVVQLINILLMPLITEYLSPREYGEIALLNLAYLFLVAIFSIGIGVSIGLCYFDFEDKREKDSLVWSGFIALIISCAILWIFGSFTSDIWSSWLIGRSEIAPIARCVLIAAIANILSTPFEARLRLDERPKMFILVSLITTLAVGLPTLLFVIGYQRGVAGYFEALALGRVVAFFMYFFAASKGAERILNWTKATKLMALGFPVVFQFVLLYILQFGNVEGLKRFVGLEAAGIYSVGLSIGLAINIVISSISNAWVPFFLSYVNKQDEAKTLFGRITTYYLFGVGIVSLFFYYFSTLFVLILSAESYLPAASIVGPIATGFYLLGIYNMALPPIYFAKEVRILTYLLALSALTLIGVGYFLIPSFGLIGAAWSFVVSYAALDVLLLLWNRLQGKRYFQIEYEVGRGLIFLFAYFISIAALTSISGISTIVMGLVSSAHLILIVALTIFLLSREERSLLRSIVYNLVTRASLSPRS